MSAELSRPAGPSAEAAPPQYAAERQQDASHLQALAVAQYIFGGLALLFAALCFVAAVTRGLPTGFGVLAGIQGVGLAAIGLGNMVSATCVRRRRRRTLSLIVAGVTCIAVPIGTVLGVLTIVVLLRESVRQSYESAR